MDILKFFITQSEQDKENKTATLTVECDLGYGHNNSVSTFLQDFESPDFFKLKSDLFQLFHWVVNHHESKYHEGVYERAPLTESVHETKISDSIVSDVFLKSDKIMDPGRNKKQAKLSTDSSM